MEFVLVSSSALARSMAHGDIADMKRQYGIALLVIGIAFGLCGCGNEAGDGRFKFALISDLHVRLPGNPDDQDHDNQGNIDNLEATVGTINSRFGDSEFVMVTGDLVGCLFSENPGDYLIGQPNPAEKCKDIMDGLDMPWYAALGNHDYHSGYDVADGAMTPANNFRNVEAIWTKVTGFQPYYSFVFKGVRFVILDSSIGPFSSTKCTFSSQETLCIGSFGEEQMSWFEAELQNPEPCLVFFHHPLITDDSDVMWSFAGDGFKVAEEDRFYEVVAANSSVIKGIFVGHGHVWANDTICGTIPVYETGSIGDYLGEADNICIVTVDANDGVFDVKQRAAR